MILYEFPFNEAIRTMLRLEHLFDRLGQLMARDSPLDHHFALQTIFELLDLAGRADLKSDLLRELERHRAQLHGYRGHPGIAEAALDQIIGRIDQAHEALNTQQSKIGQNLANNEWLMSIRSRIGIPGGTCEFDLPAYYAWQQLSPAQRRRDLEGWASGFAPLAAALHVLLALLRDSGVPQRVHAAGGHYQQRLPEGKGYQLLRVGIDGSGGLIPEITGHRLLVSVRMMRPDADGRLKPVAENAEFELALCA